MKPNPIDFDKVWIAFDDIHNNMAVLATMISIFLLYLLVIIWARRADIRDRDSQVMTNECQVFTAGGHTGPLNVLTCAFQNQLAFRPNEAIYLFIYLFFYVIFSLLTPN